MRLMRWGEPGEEKPGLVGANGSFRDLSGHIRDLSGAQLDPLALAELEKIDPLSLPEVSSETRLGPCVGKVGHFLAIGLNYADHARESGMPIPAEPIVFSKAPSCINGPYDDILIPSGSGKTDWEVELAVVIGRRTHQVAEQNALDSVAGYCVCNDLSERAYQLEHGGQWIKGKSYPSFGPLGPWLVTTAEIENVRSLRIWLDVNGERLQESNTNQMIFSVPQLIAYLSRFMVLEPGDVITTGTPPGVGMGMQPPRYLRHGDRLRCGIQALGEQQNVVAEFGQ